MPQYEYTITVHPMSEVIDRLSPRAAKSAPDVLYCDTEGDCFFDEAASPYIAAIVDILDAQGAEGWALVQVVPREKDMICFWQRRILKE